MKNVRFRRNGVDFEPTKQELKIVLDDFAKQLGERDKRIAELENQLKTFLEKWEWLDLEDVDNTLTESEQKIWEIMKKNQDLEKQLAESEEENETFRKALQGEIFINYKIPMENERLKQQLAEKDKLINEYADLAVKEIKAEDFAIDILEELDGSSNYINSKLDFECGFYISQKTIRDKIKELRGQE